MNCESIKLRFKISGSYFDPAMHHFMSSEWMSEEECRRAVFNMLSAPTIRTDSIYVIVQHMKSRWLPLRYGSAVELFPDIAAQVARNMALNALLDTPDLPSKVRLEAKSALIRGVPEALANARHLVNVLEQMQVILKC